MPFWKHIPRQLAEKKQDAPAQFRASQRAWIPGMLQDTPRILSNLESPKRIKESRPNCGSQHFSPTELDGREKEVGTKTSNTYHVQTEATSMLAQPTNAYT